MTRTQTSNRRTPTVRAGHRPRGAFTLIELLVVVAIIALLISILLPSLAKSRALGRSAVCKSNEHQVGLGLHMFLLDNKKEEVPRGTSGITEMDWVGFTLKTLGIRWKDNPSGNTQLNIPISKHAVFRCPERQLTIGARVKNELLLDYVANAICHTGPASSSSGGWRSAVVNYATKSSIWPLPSRTVYLADAATEKENDRERDASPLMGNLQWGRTKYEPHQFDFWGPMHLPVDEKVQSVPATYRTKLRISKTLHMGNSANCLFVDGHSEGVKYYGMTRERWLLLVGVQPKVAAKTNLPWD